MSEAHTVKLATAGDPVEAPQTVSSRRKRRKLRHMALGLSFLLIVVAPMITSAIYLFTLATDQYHSNSAFAVRSEDAPNPLDVIGAFTQTGSSAAPQWHAISLRVRPASTPTASVAAPRDGSHHAAPAGHKSTTMASQTPDQSPSAILRAANDPTTPSSATLLNLDDTFDP